MHMCLPLAGLIREFEANDCPDVDSQHNDHQRHLPYLWLMPEFEVSKMVKWASGQAADGHLPEYLGSFNLGTFCAVVGAALTAFE